MTESPRSIVITGASSGIGEALARYYAGPGIALALTGRDPDRLQAIATAAQKAGATVTTAMVDAADRPAMADWLAGVDAATPVDLVIANAGISAGAGRAGESEAQARRILDVNLLGVLNTIHPMIGPMRQRRRGQLALMASLAGYRGFPGAPAYCASKAAVRVYGEALRGELVRDGIKVNVICPGFVRSRITAANPFPMPFLMDADRAARIIARGLAANRGRIAFPTPTAFAAWLAMALPAALMDAIALRTPRKPAAEPAPPKAPD